MHLFGCWAVAAHTQLASMPPPDPALWKPCCDTAPSFPNEPHLNGPGGGGSGIAEIEGCSDAAAPAPQLHSVSILRGHTEQVAPRTILTVIHWFIQCQPGAPRFPNADRQAAVKRVADFTGLKEELLTSIPRTVEETVTEADVAWQLPCKILTWFRQYSHLFRLHLRRVRLRNKLRCCGT